MEPNDRGEAWFSAIGVGVYDSTLLLQRGEKKKRRWSRQGERRGGGGAPRRRSLSGDFRDYQWRAWNTIDTSEQKVKRGPPEQRDGSTQPLSDLRPTDPSRRMPRNCLQKITLVSGYNPRSSPAGCHSRRETTIKALKKPFLPNVWRPQRVCSTSRGLMFS